MQCQRDCQLLAFASLQYMVSLHPLGIHSPAHEGHSMFLRYGRQAASHSRLSQQSKLQRRICAAFWDFHPDGTIQERACARTPKTQHKIQHKMSDWLPATYCNKQSCRSTLPVCCCSSDRSKQILTGRQLSAPQTFATAASQARGGLL